MAGGGEHWMTMHQHMREGNLLKPSKNVLPQKRTVVTKACGEIYQEKKWSRKMAKDIKK